MTEGNGDKLRAWADKAALARWCWGVLVIAFIAGLVYATLDFRVKAADDRSKDNAVAIERLTDNVNKLTTGQLLLNQSVTHDRQNNAEFRLRTDKALDAIIKKLDRAERRDRSEGP
ncbi:MAG: hypothetical protein GEU92_18995 [Alphaproteobacteria bacterium]|nr:hypothetical protein [Alphaproteobacteria bacterium]